MERLNELLSKSLHLSHQAYKSSKESKNWDIELALKAWTASSNQNVHLVTKKIPYKAIHFENEKEIDEIIENIKEYYGKKTKSKVKGLELKVGTKMFIIKQVKKVKNKNKLISQEQKNLKKRTNKSKIRIPVEVVDISDLETLHVKVKICGRPYEEMKKNEIYNVAISNLEIVKSERLWNLLIDN